MASKSRRTINPSNNVVLEIITYGGSIPMQRSSLRYQNLRIAGSPRRKHGQRVKRRVEAATPRGEAGEGHVDQPQKGCGDKAVVESWTLSTYSLRTTSLHSAPGTWY